MIFEHFTHIFGCSCGHGGSMGISLVTVSGTVTLYVFDGAVDRSKILLDDCFAALAIGFQ